MDYLKLRKIEVGEIVADDIRTAEAFKNGGIDFFCGGKQSFSEACVEKGIVANVLEN